MFDGTDQVELIFNAAGGPFYQETGGIFLGKMRSDSVRISSFLL
jgi:hypothetical protein